MSRPRTMNPTFVPLQTHGVLKSLLENPMKLPLHHDDVFGKDRAEEKKLDEDRNVPQSAFLGPTLWDKTLPYDGDNFQLEYMNLEEFLSENGIPSSPSQHDQSHHHHHQHHHHQQQHQHQQHQQQQPCLQQASVSVMDLSNRATTSIHTSMIPQTCLQTPGRSALPPARHTPSPVDPETIQVPVSYDPDPTDLLITLTSRG